jgi:hypothetical protein
LNSAFILLFLAHFPQVLLDQCTDDVMTREVQSHLRHQKLIGKILYIMYFYI